MALTRNRSQILMVTAAIAYRYTIKLHVWYCSKIIFNCDNHTWRWILQFTLTFRILQIFFKQIFFKSCSESSETNFGILKVNFENFPSGAKLGSNFDRKGSIFSKFQILTINFPRIKFEAVWDNGLPPTSISSVPIQIPDILLAHPHDATCRLWEPLVTPNDLRMTWNFPESEFTCGKMYLKNF